MAVAEPHTALTLAAERTDLAPTNTSLAVERTLMAAERTLMAWIRTALSLIGFGFGIGKLAAYLDAASLHPAHDPAHTSLIFGTSFILVGILGLMAAIVQHARVLKRLSQPDFATMPCGRSP